MPKLLNQDQDFQASLALLCAGVESRWFDDWQFWVASGIFIKCYKKVGLSCAKLCGVNLIGKVLIFLKNTPGTSVGPGYGDRTLTVKIRKNTWKSGPTWCLSAMPSDLASAFAKQDARRRRGKKKENRVFKATLYENWHKTFCLDQHIFFFYLNNLKAYNSLQINNLS